VVQSFAAYWFYLRFGVEPAMLGAIFFWANVFAGFSALVASRLAARVGLVRTMVFTHPAFECPVDSCAADAESLAGGAGASSSLQHQPRWMSRRGQSYIHGGGSSGGSGQPLAVSRESHVLRCGD